MSHSSPKAIEAYRLMRAGRLVEALRLAESDVAGQSVCLPTHGMLATLLLQLGRAPDAEQVVSQALEYQEGCADAYDALAHASMLLGQHERANALYRRATMLAPGDSRFWYNLASSERSLGRLSEAEQACDRSIALDRTRYPSYLLRAELRVQTSESNHVPELQSELARCNLDDRGRMFLGYALAKELDDLQRFDEAFENLARASKIRKRHLTYNVAVDERKLQRIHEVSPASALSSVSAGTDSGRYIFIVGLPRSGTTLLEHMLMGLPGVRSNGETDNFGRALAAAAAPGTADIFARAAAARPAVVAANYRRLADAQSPDVSIIEKVPMNYLYLGAIRRTLPNSRIVLVSRQPLDSCFAMYRTLFGEAYPFSYDFDDLARYYAAYERLMAHWRACLGNSLCEVTYEELVTSPADASARVAEFCGLQWNDRAVEIHKRSTVSLTASAAQIRRPIYRSSLDRLSHYECHLEPLAQALRLRTVAHSSRPDLVAPVRTSG
ncbi:MAG: sulfotransferase [Gammaproteobacteria bacterium]